MAEGGVWAGGVLGCLRQTSSIREREMVPDCVLSAASSNWNACESRVERKLARSASSASFCLLYSSQTTATTTLRRKKVPRAMKIKKKLKAILAVV